MSIMTENVPLEAQFSTSMQNEYSSVRPELLTELFLSLHEGVDGKDSFFTADSIRGIMLTIRFYKQRTALKSANGATVSHTELVTDAAWVKFLDGLYVSYSDRSDDADKLIALLNDDRKAGNLPDALSYSVYNTLEKALGGMEKALKNELKNVAAYRGVTIDVATAKFFELRDSFGHVSDVDKAKYVATVNSWIGSGVNRMKGFKFYYVPFDYSVLYALYRMRSDVNMFAVDTMNIISLDIETAGPAGRSGFAPENGRVIEVGMVEYTPDGVEVARYETLIRPEQSFLDEHQTGAIEVHQITVEALDGAPSWDEVQGTILAFLKNKKLLAQNAKFERSWFHTLLEGFTALDMPTVDTLEMAERFLPGMENNKLATICAEVGVPYTNGHRALHDAVVTGDAYFKMASMISREW